MATTHTPSAPLSRVPLLEQKVGDSDGCLPIICVVIVLSLLIAGGLFAIAEQFVTENGGVTVAVSFGIALVITILLGKKKRPRFNYHIHIKMANGHEAVLTFQTREYHREALESINNQ